MVFIFIKRMLLNSEMYRVMQNNPANLALYISNNYGTVALRQNYPTHYVKLFLWNLTCKNPIAMAF